LRSFNFDFAALDGGYKRLVIDFRLVGVCDGEICQRLPDLYTSAAVSGNLARVAGPSMTARKQLTGYYRERIQAPTARSFKQHDVIPQFDTPRSDHLETHIDSAKQIKEVTGDLQNRLARKLLDRPAVTLADLRRPPACRATVS